MACKHAIRRCRTVAERRIRLARPHEARRSIDGKARVCDLRAFECAMEKRRYGEEPPVRLLGFGPHVREQQHIADGLGIGQEHDQTIDAHAHAACGRHAVFERADVVAVVFHSLVVAAGLRLHLGCEPLFLIDRVIELVERVRVLMAADEEFEAIGELGIVGKLLRKGRDLERMLGHERRLNELVFDEGLEDLGNELALAPRCFDRSAPAPRDGREVFEAFVEDKLVQPTFVTRTFQTKGASARYSSCLPV